MDCRLHSRCCNGCRSRLGRRRRHRRGGLRGFGFLLGQSRSRIQGCVEIGLALLLRRLGQGLIRLAPPFQPHFVQVASMTAQVSFQPRRLPLPASFRAGQARFLSSSPYPRKPPTLDYTTATFSCFSTLNLFINPFSLAHFQIPKVAMMATTARAAQSTGFLLDLATSTCFSVRFLIRVLSDVASPISRTLPAAWF